MPEFNNLIDQIFEREGGATETNDPADAGGRTAWGVSERSNPEAWADGKVTEDEARQIYLKKYVFFPKFDRIPESHAKLQEQLIDFGVNSGPQLAIMKLQRLLGLKEDGVLGPITLAAITAADPRELNNQLVAARVTMLTKVVQKSPGQLKWLGGWVQRSLDFLV